MEEGFFYFPLAVRWEEHLLGKRVFSVSRSQPSQSRHDHRVRQVAEEHTLFFTLRLSCLPSLLFFGHHLCVVLSPSEEIKRGGKKERKKILLNTIFFSGKNKNKNIFTLPTGWVICPGSFVVTFKSFPAHLLAFVTCFFQVRVRTMSS